MKPNQSVLATSLLVSLCCFGAIAWLQPTIRAERDSLEISVDSERNAQMPPDLALINAALGGFRSWAINFMWMRATKLQEENRVHEAAQLAGWITNLSPRFERVWTFQAWNLAFNVSRQADTDTERWRWVSAGIDLIRTRGLKINPLSLHLHTWLAYIYYFKIGDSLDESHRYYKTAIAREWDRLLGPPPTPADDSAVEAARVEWFRPIAISPATSADLVEAEPSYEEVFRQIAELDYRLELPFLLLFTGSDLEDPATPKEEALLRLRHDLSDRGLHARFVSFLRALVIRQRFNMDPHLMLDMMEVLGPFDWRHEASHGAYWVVEGALRRARQKVSVRLVPAESDYIVVLDRPELLICLRKLAFESGRIERDPVTGRFSRVPEPLFIRAYELARFTNSVDHVRDLFRADLEAATTTAYFFGGAELAPRYFARLQGDFGVEGTTEEFVAAALRAEVESEVEQGREIFEALESLYYNVYGKGYGIDRPDVAERFHTVVSRLYTTFALTDPLPSLSELQARSLIVYLYASPVAASVHEKSRAWLASDVEVRRSVENRALPSGTVRQFLGAMCRREGVDMNVLFPAAR